LFGGRAFISSELKLADSEIAGEGDAAFGSKSKKFVAYRRYRLRARREITLTVGCNRSLWSRLSIGVERFRAATDQRERLFPDKR